MQKYPVARPKVVSSSYLLADGHNLIRIKNETMTHDVALHDFGEPWMALSIVNKPKQKTLAPGCSAEWTSSHGSAPAANTPSC